MEFLFDVHAWCMKPLRRRRLFFINLRMSGGELPIHVANSSVIRVGCLPKTRVILYLPLKHPSGARLGAGPSAPVGEIMPPQLSILGALMSIIWSLLPSPHGVLPSED